MTTSLWNGSDIFLPTSCPLDSPALPVTVEAASCPQMLHRHVLLSVTLHGAPVQTHLSALTQAPTSKCEGLTPRETRPEQLGMGSNG